MAIADQSKRAELCALGPARQGLYSFLSAAFAGPPCDQRLDILRAEGFLGAAAGLFSQHLLDSLRDYANDAPTVAESQRQTRREFMNLFKVPGGQYVAPYESVYRDTRDVAGQPVKGLLMGQSAVDVQKWYRLAAVEIADHHKDLPDHICLELNYLAHLCGKEQQFAATGAQAQLVRAWQMQRDFLAGHLSLWVGALRDKIHEKSHHPYFRALADMTVEFVERDLATLEGVLGSSSGKPTPEYHRLDA